MGIVIPVAHDYTCSWCWIGYHQVKQLTKEFGVEFDWLGYELYPEDMPWPEPVALPEPPANKPRTPTRNQLAFAAQGIERPSVELPSQMRIHDALEATEYAKDRGVGTKFVERLYKAYWEQGLPINDHEVLRFLSTGLILDSNEMLEAVRTRRYSDRIVPFDRKAFSLGVYNLPTYFIGIERHAEQPIVVLRKALKEFLQSV